MCVCVYNVIAHLAAGCEPNFVIMNRLAALNVRCLDETKAALDAF